MYRCESWTIKKAECWRINAFQIVVLDKTLEVPLKCKEIKPVNLKDHWDFFFLKASHPLYSFSCAIWSLDISFIYLFFTSKSSIVASVHFSSVQFLSRVWLFETPWIAARQASLSITNSRSSLKLMSIELVMPSSHLTLYRPLLLLPPIPPSIRVFSNESTLRMRWPKYWSFSFSIILSKEIQGLISFRMDWLDLLAVQGTLKSLLQQHHSSKASVLWRSAFSIVQL